MRAPWAKHEPLPQLYICELMRRVYKHSRRRRARGLIPLIHMTLDEFTVEDVALFFMGTPCG